MDDWLDEIDDEVDDLLGDPDTDGSAQPRHSFPDDGYEDDAAEEVRLDPKPYEPKDTDPGRYDVVIDREQGSASLVPPSEREGLEDDRYRVLSEPPAMEEEERRYEDGKRYEGPSSLEHAAAATVAGTVTSAFMAAEAGLEATYNGLRSLVRMLD
ncbi:MAG: hypothetical protein SV186_05725 [Candidatus Nanohaloarchaea archaeon]|nr:hypothetical protein [Candidatus Nanohaloarchaea archaeon]